MPHVAPLEAYAETLRDQHGDLPHFDPFDGGIDARLLVLLATPGPSSASIRFTSRDNPTGTARALRRMFAASGIDRRETVLWNAAPWILPRRGNRLGVPGRRAIEDARDVLPGLLDLLPRIEMVLLLGRIASEIALIKLQRTSLPALVAPHPSPANLAADRTAAAKLEDAFDRAAALLRGQN